LSNAATLAESLGVAYNHLDGKKVSVRFMGVSGPWTDRQRSLYSETVTGTLHVRDLNNMIEVGNHIIGLGNLLSAVEVPDTDGVVF
jgi:hypothetical protein